MARRRLTADQVRARSGAEAKRREHEAATGVRELRGAAALRWMERRALGPDGWQRITLLRSGQPCGVAQDLDHARTWLELPHSTLSLMVELVPWGEWIAPAARAAAAAAHAAGYRSTRLRAEDRGAIEASPLVRQVLDDEEMRAARVFFREAMERLLDPAVEPSVPRRKGSRARLGAEPTA